MDSATISRLSHLTRPLAHGCRNTGARFSLLACCLRSERLRADLERKIPDLFGTIIQLRRARRVGGAVDTVLSCSGVQGGSVQNNIRFSDSPPKSMNVDLDEFYYWVQVTDENNAPVTSDTVYATLGVALIRVQ